MKREIKKYLFDIKTSIDSIFDFLGEKHDSLEYQNNKLLRRGVEREIEIIGEAMNRILKFDPSFKLIMQDKLLIPETGSFMAMVKLTML